MCVACATFLLIIAGALVTSNDAGLSVPDWPTSFGSFYKIPRMVGGVRFEHTHRMIAEFIGLLTIVIAIWTWRADRRRWMKCLGIGALGTVIAQGVLGGLTVLYFSTSLDFVCARRCRADVFLHRRLHRALHWASMGRGSSASRARHAPSQPADADAAVNLHSLCAVNSGRDVSPPRPRVGGRTWLNAIVVAFVLSWTAIRALSQYAKIDDVRRPAITLLSLLIAQLCLGFLAFLTRVAWGKDAVQPELPMVISTVAHVAMGALILATAVVLAIQVWRHVPVAFEERVASGGEDPVAA